LAGPDTKGYVALDQYRYPDANGNEILGEPADWRLYYDASDPNAASYHRFGPYAQLEGKVAQTPDYFAKNTSAARTLPPALDPSNGAAGTSSWNNGRLPFAVDAFGFPVLYYVANDQATLPFSDMNDTGGVGGLPRPGRYTEWDNATLTGTEVSSGPATGIDLGDGTDHPLKYLGWAVSDRNKEPAMKSFAGAAYDRTMFEQNKIDATHGKVWPHRPDTFLFIAAGPDALYGTPDDVANFEH
jgi:hypothetical protein